MKKILLIFALMISALTVKADFYGPYAMDDTYHSQPAGYAKVIVFTRSENASGGWVRLENTQTHEIITFNDSSVYFSIWFCYVPQGTYEVVAIGNSYDPYFGGATLLSIGDQITLSGSAAVIFEKSE